MKLFVVYLPRQIKNDLKMLQCYMQIKNCLKNIFTYKY